MYSAFENADLNTIIAALWFYKANGQGNPMSRSDTTHILATNGDTEINLDDDGIEDLILRLTGGNVIERLNRTSPTVAAIETVVGQLLSALKGCEEVVKRLICSAGQMPNLKGLNLDLVLTRSAMATDLGNEFLKAPAPLPRARLAIVLRPGQPVDLVSDNPSMATAGLTEIMVINHALAAGAAVWRVKGADGSVEMANVFMAGVRHTEIDLTHLFQSPELACGLSQPQ